MICYRWKITNRSFYFSDEILFYFPLMNKIIFSHNKSNKELNYIYLPLNEQNLFFFP